MEAQALAERGLTACLGPPPIVLELGFGRGEVLIDLARGQPGSRFLGVEVSRKRVRKTARRLQRAGVPNARLVHAPAEFLLERVLPPASIAECWINFPDPWPKKRHHKRRLIRPDVVRLLASALEPGALLHLATDHAGYRAWIAEVMAGAEGLANLHAPEPWSAAPPKRPPTAYEAEFRAEGREIGYFEYRRVVPTERG